MRTFWFPFICVLLIALVNSTTTIPKKEFFSNEEIYIEFLRQNRTYLADEVIEFNVVYNHKKDDPEISKITVRTRPEYNTFQINCENSGECLQTGNTSYQPSINIFEWSPNSSWALGENKQYFSDRNYRNGGTYSHGKSRTIPSFEGVRGSVRYYYFLTVYLKGGAHQVFENEYVYLMNGEDLSSDPSYEKPVACYQNVKISGEQLNFKVEISKTGWVFPETIPVKVTIEETRKSGWIVKQIEANVTMIQNFTTISFPRKHSFSTFNYTIASANFENTEKEDLKLITVLIRHNETSFPLTMKAIGLIEVSHFIRIAIELYDPNESLAVPISLECEFPITFGAVPTKSTGVKSPSSFIQCDPSYQNNNETVLYYPSFETLRK